MLNMNDIAKALQALDNQTDEMQVVFVDGFCDSLETVGAECPEVEPYRIEAWMLGAKQGRLLRELIINRRLGVACRNIAHILRAHGLEDEYQQILEDIE